MKLCGKFISWDT